VKISDITLAAWVNDIAVNRYNVKIVEEGIEREYATRGVVGDEVETSVVVFSDDFVQREIEFTDVMEMRKNGSIV
jgi:hypothetical protein